MFTFKGKVVWVTGSVTGIGKEIAMQFAKHGADVVVHNYDNREEAEKIVANLKEQGTNALLVEGNVTNKQDVEKNVEQIKEHFGKLDILINNVGGSPFKFPFEDIEEEHWDKMIDLNLKSTYFVTRAALPLIKEQKGTIVNTCSAVVWSGGIIGGSPYTAAKGGVEALTRALAKELAGVGVRVNGVSPGLVDTPFHDVNVGEKYPQIIDKIPLKRVGTPKDLAGAFLFLASDYADYITGEVIEVSGGSRMS
ncbi:oxidoreductase [Sporosarcina sp. P13]|uniref:SDR family NAD(P)-dependent oxidoreductase n=1 Tax=Sporosarcina sp. P13 TaxID=2048263 RepID=UPI000C173662|nr:SDR family NAD(P)-dependent oxidoreductase [Sporosarcina sp. P13]PIC63876.1 oxidoreductase [Sporosarcina sp. P13]